MNKFSNSAKRILNILINLQGKSPQTSTAQTWAGILGLDKSIVDSDPYELNQKLTLIREELNFVEEKMRGTKFSEALYKPYIDQLKPVVTPNNLAAAWSNYHHNINSELILSFKYCAEILEDELTVDFEELEKLLLKLNEFKKTVNKSILDETTRQFILNQISIIEKAIQNYPITGNIAIKKAFEEGFIDILKSTDKADSINSTENFNEKNEMLKLWKELKTIAKAVVEGDKMANALISWGERGQLLIDTTAKLLS